MKRALADVPPAPLVDAGVAIEQELMRLHGPVLDSGVLWRLLCYPTRDAFRQSVRRGVCPVEVFSMAHRRGHFALTRSVAVWLSEASARGALTNHERTKPLPVASRQGPHVTSTKEDAMT